MALSAGRAMLRELDIRDMLIIDRLSLAFQPGLNVLTGETGAGKSILLDALGFVLGWRTRAELVRPGAAQGEVTAVFELAPGHPASTVLEEAGIAAEGELILRRVTTAEGRRTGWANDRRVSAEVLRNLGELLVELHGQQDDRGLMNARGHRALLDAFGGLGPAVAACRSAWNALSAARRAAAEQEDRVAALRAEEDFLRHAAAEIEALAPEPGEEAALDQRRRLAQAGARVGEDIARAGAALGEEGAEGRMQDALRWLEGASGHLGEAADPVIEALGRAIAELGEAQDGIGELIAALAFDPLELERIEERLFAIRAASRKHGVMPDDLAELGARFSAQLAALEGGVEDSARLARAVAQAEAAYDSAATALSASRTEAAGRLDAAIAEELPALKLERARFHTSVSAGDPGPEGRDAVEFTVSTNPGTPPGPLGRIASGGELSRFLLALKVCLAGDTPATMIFDEIDRGVGGATADAVGRRLARLATSGQVLAVTHSPQVAAQGAHHWQVAKEMAGAAALSRVRALDAAARVDEIARMLSGDAVTEAAREAARVLLEGR